MIGEPSSVSCRVMAEAEFVTLPGSLRCSVRRTWFRV